MEYKIGIYDDEYHCMSRIKEVVEEYFKQHNKQCTITLFTDKNDLLLQANALDILFLDVEIGDVNGLKIKDQLQTYHKLHIVFVSNYEAYKDEAYGRNVMRYILKNQLYMIDKALDTILVLTDDYKSLVIENRNIKVNTIYYVEANGSYCNLFVEDANYISSKGLTNIQKELTGEFVQVHRSYIVNMDYIKDIYKNVVILQNNIEIPLSRRKRTEIQNQYHDYILRKLV